MGLLNDSIQLKFQRRSSRLGKPEVGAYTELKVEGGARRDLYVWVVSSKWNVFWCVVKNESFWRMAEVRFD